MGLIQIRERSERLGGLPGVRMADTRTGAADALMGISRVRQASRAADAGIVSTIGNVAQGAAKIAANFLEERDRDAADAAKIAANFLKERDRDAADAAAQAYMKEKRAEYFGTTDENGNFVAGRLQRNMEDPGSYVADAQDYDKDLAERHFGGLSKNARQMAERAVAGLDLQTQNAVVARATKEWQSRRVAAAEEGLRQHSQNVLDIPDIADAGARAAAWGAWNDQVERILDVQGVTDPATRREFRRKNAEALVSAALARKVQTLKEQTNGLAPEVVEDAFDGLEGQLAELGYRAVIYGDVENAAGEPLADWLDDDLKTSDHKALKAALTDQLEKAKGAAMREAEAWERERRQAVGRDFTERELKLRDVPQELWADKYEEMGKDPTLRKADPKRAMAYMDAANEMRTAASKAKEKASADAIKGNEDRIYGRLIDFIYAKKFGLLSGQAAADEQAAVWRDFRVAVTGKAVGENFPDKFTARLDKELNDQQAEAMRYTMQLFGYDAETDSRGRVGAAERNKATNDGLTFKTPFKVEGWFGDFQPTISASQLFDVLDRQWRLLDGQDKGGNRLEAAKKMAEGAKEEWLHGGYDGMIEGMADAFMRNEVDRRSGEEYREAE